MDPGTRPYAIWLMPGPAEHGRLNNVVRSLAQEFGSAPFEPHLTLYAGMCQDLNVARDALVTACQGVTTFVLPTRGMGYTDDFFKTFFIELHPSPALVALHAALKAALKDVYLLQPHVSLLYQTLPRATQEALQKRHPLTLPEIAFPQVKLVTTDDKGGWRAITSWRTVHTQALLPAA